MWQYLKLVSTTVTVFLAIGCGQVEDKGGDGGIDGNDGGGQQDGDAGTFSYFPLSVGNEWKYVSSGWGAALSGQYGTSISWEGESLFVSIDDFAEDQGLEKYHLVFNKVSFDKDGVREDDSWDFWVTDTFEGKPALVNLKEGPMRVVLSEEPMSPTTTGSTLICSVCSLGASGMSSYFEGPQEDVTVPAGEFSARTTSYSGSCGFQVENSEHFVKNLGIVKAYCFRAIMGGPMVGAESTHLLACFTDSEGNTTGECDVKYAGEECSQDEECAEGFICKESYCKPGCYNDSRCPDGTYCKGEYCGSDCNEEER